MVGSRHDIDIDWAGQNTVLQVPEAQVAGMRLPTIA